MSKAEVQQVLQEVQQKSWFTNAEGFLRSQGDREAMRHIGGDCLYMSWQFACRYRECFPDRKAGLLLEVGRPESSGHVAAAAQGKNHQRWFCDPCYFMREPLSLSSALRGRKRQTTIADFTAKHPLIIEGSDLFYDMIHESFQGPDHSFEKAFDTTMVDVNPNIPPFSMETSTRQKSHLYIYGLFPNHHRDKWKVWIDYKTGEISVSAKYARVQELIGSLDTTAFLERICAIHGTTYAKVYQLLQDAREIHNGMYPLGLQTEQQM